MQQQQQRTDQSTILHYTRRMGGSEKTHEDKHPIGVPFPTVYLLTVLFPGPTEIHREQSFRTIGKVMILPVGLDLSGKVSAGKDGHLQKGVRTRRLWMNDRSVPLDPAPHRLQILFQEYCSLGQALEEGRGILKTLGKFEYPSAS